MIITEIKDDSTIEIEDCLRSKNEEFIEEKIQDNLTVEDSTEDKQDFAAMNGVNITFETDEAVNETEVPEPEEVTTTRPTSQNPLIKVAVISGITLLFVALIGGVISGSMNALKLSTTKKIEAPEKTEEVAATVKDESGTDKAALALTRQSMAMEKMRNLKAKPDIKITATPLPKPVTVASTPTRRIIVQNPERRNYTPPVVQRSSPVYRPQPQPEAKPLVKTVPATSLHKVDPMQQWLAVANVGSFGANTTTTLPATVNDLESAEGIEGGIGKPTSSSKPSMASRKVDKQAQDSSLENINDGQERVLVGTHTEGKLETPIVWSRNHENQVNQNYLIKLSQPLKSSTGSEILPKNSYIVAQILGNKNSEYIQLQAVSALVNKNGEPEEKLIPEGTILILSKNGKSLKAELHRGSDLGRTIFASVLAGVTKAAELQNRPTSQITTNYDGFSSSVITNDNKDLVAGFAQGTLSEVVRNIQLNNQRQTQQLESEDKVFVIDAGKEVQVFVNQTINL
ncbi:hypothetical protein H6G80_33685 [Nostoc sp. FACHB-87]|uniref:TrbI/VirB10 family protein n=1 Tax=Nostocales TaxID=1161 RepID=UPI0016874C7E|nr:MULTISPECIES: TrbI/VirB10 family protein [Nostocales]MBD2303391.1 hypothetical protein [Nostoc sp. FACHB-190]MBD2458990.1 hypothetical protein [Nostoc sp. FACHB-87]MBD2480001.1 hypothetical protein [Anabaena sp. FACHB-83]MBD2492127.1 hypothetical protein [Aulosira sp. FACHB-615]